MTFRRRWDINTRTQIISLGPALLLTLLLISFFTFVRIQDLRQELNHTGQLIANQLAPAAEYGVISGNNEVLESLLKATLATPNVRFLEVQDSANRILVYVEHPSETYTRSQQVEYAALASESTEHLLKVINDILDFSRIERSELELEHIPFNLADLIGSCAQSFQHLSLIHI